MHCSSYSQKTWLLENEKRANDSTCEITGVPVNVFKEMKDR